MLSSDFRSLLFVNNKAIPGTQDIYWATVLTEVRSVFERVGLPWKGYIPGLGSVTVSDPTPPRTIVPGSKADLAQAPSVCEAVYEEVENRFRVRLTPALPSRATPLLISNNRIQGMSSVKGVAHFQNRNLADLPHLMAWVVDREKSSSDFKHYMDNLLQGLIDHPSFDRSSDAIFKLAQSMQISPGLVLAASVWRGLEKTRGALVVGEQQSSHAFAAEFFFEAGDTIPRLPPRGAVTLTRSLFTGPRSKWSSEFESAPGPSFAELSIVEE